jgi:hypothetical protein
MNHLLILHCSAQTPSTPQNVKSPWILFASGPKPRRNDMDPIRGTVDDKLLQRKLHHINT